MQFEPGTRLGPYEIVSQIGQGGMGVVLKARDTRLEREVAVKVLPRNLAGDAPGPVWSFATESGIAPANIALFYNGDWVLRACNSTAANPLQVQALPRPRERSNGPRPPQGRSCG